MNILRAGKHTQSKNWKTCLLKFERFENDQIIMGDLPKEKNEKEFLRWSHCNE
jgi:hypothetical protein